MGLAMASFTRIFSPPAAAPVLCRPNRRWARPSPGGLLRLVVAKVIDETPNAKTFVLDAPGLDYSAGQHLTIVAKVDGKEHRRCYSLSTSPLAGSQPAITVKRVEGGTLSSWLHDRVRAGDVLRAAPAAGRFTIDADHAASRHVAMVAGGVGITPLISMFETLLRSQKQSRVTLLYGSRCQDEIIFRSRIDAMQKLFGRRLDVILAVDEAGPGWNGLTGPIDAARVAAVLRDRDVDSWYVCGPGPMMNGVVGALEARGVAGDRIHLERFQYAESSTTAAPTTAATLVFGASAKTVIAKPGATLLEAADAAGITLPSSCRMGGCGACKIRIDGNVVAAEPNCLTPAERADGYALACCSFGDGRVVIRDF
ncbi:MAG TPA: ferredoxin--NADP reductase [Candidatus Binatia bacterium]